MYVYIYRCTGFRRERIEETAYPATLDPEVWKLVAEANFNESCSRLAAVYVLSKRV